MESAQKNIYDPKRKATHEHKRSQNKTSLCKRQKTVMSFFLQKTFFHLTVFLSGFFFNICLSLYVFLWLCLSVFSLLPFHPPLICLASVSVAVPFPLKANTALLMAKAAPLSITSRLLHQINPLADTAHFPCLERESKGGGRKKEKRRNRWRNTEREEERQKD